MSGCEAVEPGALLQQQQESGTPLSCGGDGAAGVVHSPSPAALQQPQSVPSSPAPPQQEQPQHDPQASLLLQHPVWQQLFSSVAQLDLTSDLVVHLLQHSKAQQQQQQHQQHSDTPQQLQRADSGGSTEQPDDSSGRSNSTASSDAAAAASASALDELQQQLSALLAEKQRIEADRQDMALQQGQYKGTIAQVPTDRGVVCCAVLVW